MASSTLISENLYVIMYLSVFLYKTLWFQDFHILWIEAIWNNVYTHQVKLHNKINTAMLLALYLGWEYVLLDLFEDVAGSDLHLQLKENKTTWRAMQGETPKEKKLRKN